MTLTFEGCEIIAGKDDTFDVTIRFVQAMEGRATLYLTVKTLSQAQRLTAQLAKAEVEVYERQKLRGAGG